VAGTDMEELLDAPQALIDLCEEGEFFRSQAVLLNSSPHGLFALADESLQLFLFDEDLSRRKPHD
jgi:hypothetical protein